MTKNELRKAMRSLNRGLDPAARALASARIIERMEALEAFAGARTVGLFCSMHDEPDLGEALKRWCGVKRLAVPRVEGTTMRFFEYDPQTLFPGAFGILEPGPSAVPCPVEEIDLLFVPGVAFTPGGLRCGRGRGYYDQYLSLAGCRAVKVGVCFAHQLVDALPAEPHDIRMDAVVTDR